MQIRPTSNIRQTSGVQIQPPTNSTTSTNSTSMPVDKLEISPEAQVMGAQATASDVRADRVADIRAQIAKGDYETTDKLDAAVGRLLNEIA